jgi:hypothetical protein
VQDPIKQVFQDFVHDKLTLHGTYSESCDVLFEGPCCCGVWHTPEALPYRCGPNVWDALEKACSQNSIVIPGDVDPDVWLVLNIMEW